MKRIAICLALIGAMVPAAGLAQSSAGSGDRPDADPERYVLSPAGESFLRLDRQTGRISQCLKRDETWRCVLVPDVQIVLEEEVARLSEEVASLRAENRRLAAKAGEPPAAEDSAPAAPKGGERHSLTPEEEKEIDRAMDFTEKAMRRFFGMMRTLRQEYDSFAE
ncbi:hypothetical protein [Stappia indica]|uniref:hypothetical protein n=1 Tax=Stappia indica TaxID=538381 RepID=UPI001D183F82|nr:hypothetical protein [Stappia indica]MCC4243896.1 hypothetical protein [Stappia indica]